MTKMIVAKISDVIDRVNEWVGNKARWLVVFLMLSIIYEVVSRYVFSAPTNWSYDVSYMLGGSFFILGEGYTLLWNRHVRIDVFYSRFSKRKKAIVDMCLYCIFFFPLWGVLLYVSVPYVLLSWKMGECTTQGYYLAPFKTVLVIGILLFLLQGVAVFFHAIQQIRSEV